MAHASVVQGSGGGAEALGDAGDHPRKTQEGTHHPDQPARAGPAHGASFPVGAMLIGKHWDESTIYADAAASEGAGD